MTKEEMWLIINGLREELKEKEKEIEHLTNEVLWLEEMVSKLERRN